jgi:hypothetical protein
MRDFSKEERMEMMQRGMRRVGFLSQTMCGCWRNCLDHYVERVIQIVPW